LGNQVILVGGTEALELCQKLKQKPISGCVLINPVLDDAVTSTLIENVRSRSMLARAGYAGLLSYVMSLVTSAPSEQPERSALSDTQLALLRRDRLRASYWHAFAAQLERTEQLLKKPSPSLRTRPYRNVSAVVMTFPESPLPVLNTLMFNSNERLMRNNEQLFGGGDDVDATQLVFVEQGVLSCANEIADEIRRTYAVARGEDTSRWAKETRQSSAEHFVHYSDVYSGGGGGDHFGHDHGHDHGHSHGHDHGHSHGHHH
jgi:hypothetical protein